jgi:glucoamylase
LLTGERAHYELAAGNLERARELLHTLEGFANESGLLPEQVWDAADLPTRELWFGKPAGSAMPLVWAHAEYVKLCRSLTDNRVFDMPPQTVARYQRDGVSSSLNLWRFNNKLQTMRVGRTLRLELMSPALLHWSIDGWRTTTDTTTRETGLGIYITDLPTSELGAGVTIQFTFYWPIEQRWEGVDYSVLIVD